MLEPGMHSRWEDQICRSQLLDSTQSLELRSVHQFNFERSHLDVAMDRIADQFLLIHAPYPDGLASHNGSCVRNSTKWQSTPFPILSSTLILSVWTGPA